MCLTFLDSLLLVLQDQVLEGVDVCDLLELVTVILYEVHDEIFDILSFDELEELQTSRVQEIVARHCFEEYVEDRVEEMILNDFIVVQGLMKADTGSEIFQSS